MVITFLSSFTSLEELEVLPSTSTLLKQADQPIQFIKQILLLNPTTFVTKTTTILQIRYCALGSTLQHNTLVLQEEKGELNTTDVFIKKYDANKTDTQPTHKRLCMRDEYNNQFAGLSNSICRSI